ncbi:MAG TPA: crossover junction endodeoxyribonuclease RuvC [Vitreimonas sp.]|nr:crossover junction endodeoxyribonuclease RuvC [Vitreimonas sp.]
MSTVLAIDPGYDRLGWAVAKVATTKIELLQYGLLQTKKTQSRWERYQEVITLLSELMTSYQPTELAIETLFFSKNTTSAMQVSEVRGLIFAEALKNHLTIFEYNPMTIKQAVTGTGKADKRAVEKMVRLQLKLSEVKLVDDTLDALAVLITHSAINI